VSMHNNPSSKNSKFNKKIIYLRVIIPQFAKLQAVKVDFIGGFLLALSRAYIIHHSIYFICFCAGYYINIRLWNPSRSHLACPLHICQRIRILLLVVQILLLELPVSKLCPGIKRSCQLSPHQGSIRPSGKNVHLVETHQTHLSYHATRLRPCYELHLFFPSAFQLDGHFNGALKMPPMGMNGTYQCPRFSGLCVSEHVLQPMRFGEIERPTTNPFPSLLWSLPENIPYQTPEYENDVFSHNRH
ncbi:hypothetical protein, partial [Bradyrhizobium lupini]|uniref:hypothetical protein n=1 Tax=Rhizobium lupini TaxID=136996 RepID=UPI00296FE006